MASLLFKKPAYRTGKMTAHVLWYAVKTQAQADPYMNAYTK